ncbi:MAG TPA: presenilin family intramembrane aspartyl protease [Candidatus Nanoarchaeia archaeon]|nr:presenilin family intramembrane aspartyl protease [Candidatus Nanoarchaeia archaeon]
MKHSYSITAIILGVFFLSQLLGLVIINNYIDHDLLSATGRVSFKALPLGLEAPETSGAESFLTIALSILIGTGLALLLIKFRLGSVWKIWFLLAVFISLHVAFSSFVSNTIAGVAALVFSLWKIFKPNVFVHNFTEMFVYGGLAAIFVNMLDLFAVILLLLFISAYDVYAVWKSKHMVKLAKFQTDSKLFAGIMIPYKLPPMKADKKMKGKKIMIKTAILGGGDVAFPLLFTGVVFKGLLLMNPVSLAFAKILILPICATAALGWLLVEAEKDKFYPAMPPISFGCFVGYIIMKLLGFL